MTYPRHHTIDHYLQKVRRHTEPYLAEVYGKEIVIFPHVMSPKYDRSAQMMLSMMPSHKDKSVLEIGSGTGILSLHAALGGAQQIVAVDLNEHAVRNTEENFRKYGITNASVFKSDLFASIQGSFDRILFNAPFHGNKAEDILELGTSDYNYETLTRFLEEARRHLANKGIIYLGFADTGDNELLGRLIKKFGYEIQDFKTYPNGDWTMYLYTLSPKQDSGVNQE